jgi:hypothetical protein
LAGEQRQKIEAGQAYTALFDPNVEGAGNVEWGEGDLF